VVGVAIADPTSPIAARVWIHGTGQLDDVLIAERLDRAHGLRAAWFPRGGAHETDAYRLVHGEGDRMPGIVMDRYRDIVIVRADGAAAEALLRRHQRTFTERLRAWGVTSAALRRGADDFESWFGDVVPERLEVSEHGMRFSVDLRHGQKTGAFLDQRENRRRAREMSSGRSVLNLFSYAGGFSLAAALGGASAVTSVDIASSAHVAAQRSMVLNGLDLRAHSFVTSDVFVFLEQAHARGRRWDLVICDPPSFAPNERSKPRAVTAYRKLHRACADVLAPGGVLCAASCSSHISMDDFLSTLTDETLGRDLRVTEVFGPPADHPTLAAFPEGRYLKFVVLQ
jgi:23S rRNA (cytosine1962-C5)-methyltransferase